MKIVGSKVLTPTHQDSIKITKVFMATNKITWLSVHSSVKCPFLPGEAQSIIYFQSSIVDVLSALWRTGSLRKGFKYINNIFKDNSLAWPKYYIGRLEQFKGIF